MDQSTKTSKPITSSTVLRYLFLFTLGTFFLLCISLFRPNVVNPFIIAQNRPPLIAVNSSLSQRIPRPNHNDSVCPDILHGMTDGHWIKLAVNEKDQKDMDDYLRKSRGQFHIPPNFQVSSF